LSTSLSLKKLAQQTIFIFDTAVEIKLVAAIKLWIKLKVEQNYSYIIVAYITYYQSIHILIQVTGQNKKLFI